MLKKNLLFFIFVFDFLFSQPSQIKVGADKIINEEKYLIEGKNIGVITNHTALLSTGEHLIDELQKLENVKIAALFGPEHGIRGLTFEGNIKDSIDEKTGIPIFSLYGNQNKPSAEKLKNIDLLLFDIQDVGARFYTYLSTMILSIEAAAENNIPIIILDRPNPIRGTVVDGPLMIDSLKSFVGIIPIPIQHGMTLGELAILANNSGFLKNNIKANLTVVKVDGWRRSMWYDETNLNWLQLSPNMKTMKTAAIYPGLCLIEGTNVSEGRGTENPFETIGAPWIDSEKFATELNSLKLSGVKFVPKSYTPIDNSGISNATKYNGEACNGVFIQVTRRNLFQPIKTGIAVLTILQKMYPSEFKFSNKRFDRLAGNSFVREGILKGSDYLKISNKWKNEVDNFAKLRNKFLLYKD
ncbi:MAG: DUF1343 domain-containing protein [Bacteroidetes bacterium]|nr:DUF1343 domain-containing protein [Bacteroidota bacterium]